VSLYGRLSPTVSQINSTAMRRARDRPRAYRRWGVGHEYDNFVFTGTVLERPERPIQTAYTLGKSLRALLNLIVANLVFYGILVVANFGARALALPFPINFAVLLLLLVLPVAISAPLIWRYVRAAFIELPVDSHLADFGRAIAEAFRSTGLAPMSPDQVRVREDATGTYWVLLQSKDREAVDAFAAAYRQLFEPIVDQRYLVVREETAISGTFYAPIWYVLRGLFRLARRGNITYHPVPTAFSRRRELADQFAAAWKRWVGGGELVYTRSRQGMEILLRERVSRRRLPRAAALEEWR
jgi:hypothetical protein